MAIRGEREKCRMFCCCSQSRDLGSSIHANCKRVRGRAYRVHVATMVQEGSINKLIMHAVFKLLRSLQQRAVYGLSICHELSTPFLYQLLLMAIRRCCHWSLTYELQITDWQDCTRGSLRGERAQGLIGWRWT